MPPYVAYFAYFATVFDGLVFRVEVYADMHADDVLQSGQKAPDLSANDSETAAWTMTGLAASWQLC